MSNKMSFSFELADLMEEEDMDSSYTQSFAPHRFFDSLTEFTADVAPLDGEAEPEGCGLDQQSTDDHTYNQAPLSYELQQGLRILKELMSDSNKSVNWHFLNPVDANHPETADYYQRIKKPIWLGKMKEKFDNREYETITQFVTDFRQMLENCYRFNGPDHFVSRRAQKMETMMEQKLNLLSRELREKTSIAATSGQFVDENFPILPGMRRRSRAVVPHDSTALLNQLRVEEIQKEKEVRKQQLIDRKAVLDAHVQGMMEWEDKLMEDHKEEVKAMWELPSIGLLLFLCHYPLNIGEVAQFELERCLFMTRESSTLQRVMTTLLSTPFQRHKLEKTGMMPYRVWNEKLRDKMAPWFKLLKDSQDPNKAADKFGIDPFLFQVVGKKNPMRKKKFHEFSLYKKVWILKSLCDHCVESQESLVKTIESQYPEEQKEYRLGEDADGNTYLHFPQFCGADVRIYRRAYIPEPEYDEPDLEEEEPAKIATKRKPEKKDRSRDRSKSKEKTPVPKKKTKTVKTFTSEVPVPPANRPSRLRQTIKTVLPVTMNEDSSTDEDEFESAEEEGTQSESESKSESEEPDGCNDSGIENNTPFKNILRNRITDRDNFSETSSLDSEMWGIHRTRSGRIRFNGAMRMNNVFALTNENSCDFDSTLSESSNQCHTEKDKHVLGIVKDACHPDFDSVEKNFIGLSDDGSNSILCHKTVDERGDNLSETASNNDMISKTENFHECGLENVGNCEIDMREIQNRETESPFCDFQTCDSNTSLTPDKNFVDTNEDSSTSNDFSEIDSQAPLLDGNTSDDCSHQKNDIETISRIFDENMSEKICGNDSDTNSSFRNVTMATDGIRDEQNMASNNLSPNIIKAAINNKSDVMSFDEKVHGENLDTLIRNQEICKIGGKVANKNNDSSDETDTEFSDKLELNDIDKTITDDIERDDLESCNNDLLSHNKDETIEKDCAEEKDQKHQRNAESVDVKGEIDDLSCDGTKNNLPDSFKIVNIKEEPGDATVEDKEDINRVAMVTKNTEEEKSFLFDVKEEPEEISESMEEIQEEIVTSKVKEEVKEEISSEVEVKEEIAESDDEDDDTDLITGPVIGPFELVADCVDDLRNLVEKFAEAEPYTVGRGKKTKVVKPPARKKCVVQLHNRLVYLLKELEPWEQKLVQATKKARLKMKKEHKEYDEKVDNGWESDHSESTNSAVEDNAMEPEVTPGKPRMSSVPKDNSFLLQNEDSRASDDCGEWDISLRGRIRKRRIIPNNVEDQGLSKKRKTDSVPVTTTHQPNILSLGKSTSANMVSLVTSNTSQLGSQSPGHLLLHTSGGQTYYTGLNQQSLSSLRMLSQTKQTAHPIIQQLLRQPGMTAPRPLVSTATSTSQTMPSGSKLTTRPVTTLQKPMVAASKGTQPAGKVQYFAANINSLPPAVIQQLIKSNALTIQAGNSQQGMILLTAVNPAESESSEEAKATLTVQDPLSVKTTNPVEQIPSSLVTSTEHNKLGNGIQYNQVKAKNELSKNASDRSQPSSNQIPQTSKDTNVPDLQAKQSDYQRYTCTSMSSSITSAGILMAQQETLKKSVQEVPISLQNEGAHSVPISLPQTTQQKIKVVLQPNQYTVDPPANQGVRLQNMGMNLINSGGYVLNTGQNQGVALQLNPTLNVGQNMLNIGGQGLTLQQIQALALQGINLQGISIQGSNLVVQPAGLRIQNPENVQGQAVSHVSSTAVQNVGNLSNLSSVVIPQQGVVGSPNGSSNQTDSALKGLLNTASCSISGLCPPISPVINSVQSIMHTSSVTDIGSSVQGREISSSPVIGLPVSPGRTQCKYASNVTVKTLLEARKPSFTETSPENHGTIIVQSTATGVKKIKLPSKAALDSAIQTVVTEVKTSLPTVNIKVPSPATMPSIQPRRNITKTIQSMKGPITTTSKLEAKTSGPISVQISPPNSIQPTSPVVGQPSLVQPNSLSSGVLNLNQLNNGGQIMLTNLKSNSNIPTGQNVVQGYLTPQGLIIPSANFKNMQKIGNSNISGNVSSGIEQNALSLQSSGQTLTNSLTNSTISNNIHVPEKLTSQNSRDLKHLQNVQDLRSIAAINANLVQQIGSQQFVQKSVGTTIVKTPTAAGNFLYLSPSANLQPGSQIILNSNQPLAPVPLTKGTTATKATTILSSSTPQSHYALSTAVNNVQSTALSIGTVKQAKSPVISLPLSTDPTTNINKSVSLTPIISTFTSNATLLSHLNSPVLKAGVNQFPIATSSSLPTQVNGQNRLVVNTLASPFSTPTRLQKPVVASQMTKQAPVLINQQGSSSEIMKQLAAAQALGTPVQQITNTQGSSLTMAGGNKLFVHMPGQANLVNTSMDGKMVLQLPGQLQLNANVGNQGKLVIPAPNLGQGFSTVSSVAQSVNAGLLGQQKSIPATSLANKVMIQVPGQSQTGSTMLLISPQKQFVLGSQKSVSQALVQQSPQVQQVNVQNSTKSEKDPIYLQQTVQKVGKMTDIPMVKGQITYENSVKLSSSAGNSLTNQKLSFSAGNSLTNQKLAFSAGNSLTNQKLSSSAGNNLASQISTTQPLMGLMQQNTQKTVNTTPLVLPGNKSSVVAINSISTGLSTSAKSMSSLQTTSNQSPAKASGMPGTPQKLFLYNINGQLVTAQGVPVTVDNGILKILPQPKIQMANFNLPKSPPASTKPGQHGNVPISPKPGQSTTSTQQAYLNILSSNNASSAPSVQMLSKSHTLSSSVAMQQLVKSQPSVSAGSIGTNQTVKIQQSQSITGIEAVQQGRTQTSHLLAGIEASQPKTVVRNLNANLNSVQTSSVSANYIAKQIVSIPSIGSVSAPSIGSVSVPSIGSVSKMAVSDLVKAKPSYGFVVMPETGGQTQIVFPQPNIHSNQSPKALVNSVQGNSLSSLSFSHISGSIPTGDSSINSSRTLVQSLPTTLQINSSAQKVSNNVMSANSNYHGNINGQKELTPNPKVTNNVGNSNNASIVDTEEAALNLLSLANQRFSS